jgi:hypothetical protein
MSAWTRRLLTRCASRRTSSSFWLRIAVSITGSAAADLDHLPHCMGSRPPPSTRALAIQAWISTAGSAASLRTAAMLCACALQEEPGGRRAAPRTSSR